MLKYLRTWLLLALCGLQRSLLVKPASTPGTLQASNKELASTALLPEAQTSAAVGVIGNNSGVSFHEASALDDGKGDTRQHLQSSPADGLISSGRQQHLGQESSLAAAHQRQLLSRRRHQAGTGTAHLAAKVLTRASRLSPDLLEKLEPVSRAENDKDETNPAEAKGLATNQQAEGKLQAAVSAALHGAGKQAQQASKQLLPTAKVLQICLMSADFWGLKTAGGTATAYHLLAAVLATNQSFQVTFLGASSQYEVCQEAKPVNSKAGIQFECLEPRHFEPEIIETYPYEQLSHAALTWLMENADRCDVVHVHEWGGAFVDVITAAHYVQVKPGLRVAVEPHGGHFWSTQGQKQQAMDVMTLRIDNQERMANELNAVEISPTSYMLAFLKQRGWQLPNATIVIPNVIADGKSSDAAVKAMGQEKPVWRLAFFSRLEERKGIKLFVNAVSRMRIADPSKFEVFFVGSESQIDMQPSSKWLRHKTAKWPFKTHLQIGATRDEALSILSQDGILLVLCSLIDNMPYVVVEAAMEAIPFVVFDVGGTLELFDGKTHRDNVVLEPTEDALLARLTEVMAQGKIKTVTLSERVTSGQQQWLQWHNDFAAQQSATLKGDQETWSRASPPAKPDSGVQVIKVKARHSALELWEQVCSSSGSSAIPPEQPLLFLPPEYELLDPKNNLPFLYRLMAISRQRRTQVGALVLGSVLPNGKHSFPSSPTWMLYSDDSHSCVENVPVLTTQQTFCTAFLAEARVFRHYYSWVVSSLLNQQNMQMHTFPRALFHVLNFTASGPSCLPSKVPADRALTSSEASTLHHDSEELLRNIYVAPYTKPLASFVDDLPTRQRHLGWQIGYYAGDEKQMTPLKWHAAESGQDLDGSWGCAATQHMYPSVHQSLLHPCTTTEGGCCGNSNHTRLVLRFQSFFYEDNAQLLLAYEVTPACGERLDFTVIYIPAGIAKPKILARRGFDVDPSGTSNRQKLEWRLPMRVGDTIDFVLDPRKNHDCDGLFLVNMQIWPDDRDIASQ